MFADYNFVNPTSPACAQILIIVLQALGIEINKEIGTCLLTGIITDTGGFKYSGVTAETFEFAAELLNSGVNVSSIYKKVLQTLTKSSFELRRIAMNRLEFLEDGKIAFTYINKSDEEKVGAINNDQVIVEITSKKGMRLEGRILKVIERKLQQFVGKVYFKHNKCMVDLDDKKVNLDIVVDSDKSFCEDIYSYN